MPGAFGGALEPGEEIARELLPGMIPDLLAHEGENAAPAPVGLVPIHGAAGELVYRGDLRGLAPLARGDLGPTLRALADTAHALGALHASGRAHGDLRAAHVWTGTRTLLSYVEKPIDAGVLLRARLRQGADPTDVAFAAPEVVAGEQARPASDVFSLGALLYWAVTGRRPHGRVAMPARIALAARLEELMFRSLEPEAAARPSLHELATELEREAPAPAPVVAPASDAPAAPTPTPVPEPVAPLVVHVRKIEAPPADLEDIPFAEVVEDEPVGVAASPVKPKPPLPRHHPAVEREGPAESSREEPKASPLILNVILGLGVILVLTGALWLVAKGWDAIGDWGRFALLVGLTGGIGAGGRFLETRGNARSGLALVILSSQLLWAVGADLLAINGVAQSWGPWAFTASAVAAVGYGLAIKRRSPVLGVLASIGALMALVFTWQALDAAGHSVLLTLATAGLAASAIVLDRRGHAAAPALHFLWSQLLWLDGGYFLAAIDKNTEGPWAIVAGTAAAAALGLAAWRASVVFAFFGTIAASLALVLTGVALKAGAIAGPAEWTLICAATLYALGAGLAHGTKDAVGAPSVLASSLFALMAAILALAVEQEAPSFALGWPYFVGGLAALMALVTRRKLVLSAPALVVATFVLTGTPIFHAAAASGPDLYRHGGAIAGGVLIAAGVLLHRKPALQTSVYLVAAAHVSLERSNALTMSAAAAALLVAAWQGRLEVFAFLAALVSAGALVLWGGVLGEPLPDVLSRGSGSVFWAEWGLLSAFVLAGLGFLLERRRLGAPFALVAGVFALGSALAALSSGALVFSVEWPYLVGALAAGGALASARLGIERARTGAAVIAAIVLAGTPTWHGFSQGPALEGYRLGAPVAGALLLVGAFAWPRSRSLPPVLLAASLAGIAHVAASRSPAAVVGAVAFALLGHGILLRSSPLAAVGSLGGTVALALWGNALGLSEAKDIAEWAGFSAAVLAGCALFANRVGADEAGVPAAACAALLVLASFGPTLLPARETPLLLEVWPYFLAVACVAIAFVAPGGRGAEPPSEQAGRGAKPPSQQAGRGAEPPSQQAGRGAEPPSQRPPYCWIAVAPAALILLVTPSFRALLHSTEHAYLQVGTVVGTLVVVAAFHWRLLSERPEVQILAVLDGLASIAIAPTFLAIARLYDQNGDRLFLDLLDPRLGPAERVEHPLFYLPYLVITSAVLVTLGLLYSRSAERRAPYRLLEVSGLAIFFGTLSLLSFLRWEEFLYPAVLFAGGFLAIGAGAWGRHVLLVLVPAVALLLQAWFQYFAKLHDKAPIGLLILGFGIGLLAGGTFFEKRVRHRLGELSRWA
jgi:hypothetical protein